MAFGAQPQRSRQYGPSAEQMAIAQMGQFAQQPDSLAGILSQLNAITSPSMSPYGGGGTSVLVMPQTQPTTSRSGGAQGAAQAGANGAGAASQASQSLGSLGKSAQTLYNLLKGSSAVPTSMADTALGGAGLPSGLTAAEQASLSSAFTGAPVAGSVADAMGLTAGSLAPLSASALAPVGTGAVTAAGNAAGASAASELASALGTQAPTTAAAPAASGAGAGAAGLGALAADAGALGAIGYAGYNAMTMPQNNGWSIGDIAQLGKNVQNATNAGTISPGTAGLTAPAGSLNPINPNGSVNTGLMSALQSLNQLSLGSFGGANGYAQQLLNGAGYQTIGQADPSGAFSGGTPAASGLLTNLLRARY